MQNRNTSQKKLDKNFAVILGSWDRLAPQYAGISLAWSNVQHTAIVSGMEKFPPWNVRRYTRGSIEITIYPMNSTGGPTF